MGFVMVGSLVLIVVAAILWRHSLAYAGRATIEVRQKRAREITDMSLVAAGRLPVLWTHQGPAYFLVDAKGKEWRVLLQTYSQVEVGETVALVQFGDMWRIKGHKPKCSVY